MKKVIEHLPLLTIAALYIAFCNLNYYYEPFKIEIFQYVNTSEALLLLLPQVLIIAGIGWGILFAMLTTQKEGITTQETSEPRTTKKESRIINVYLIVGAAVLLIWYYAKLFILPHSTYKLYQFRTVDALVMWFYLLFMIMAYAKGGETDFFRKNANLLSLILVLFAGKTLGSYRSYEAQELIDRGNKLQFRIGYKGRVITSGSGLVMIGGTQSSLFLFNRKDSTTVVIARSNIDSLIIK